MAARPSKDDRAYVYDMLESARLAAGHLEGLALGRFLGDSKTQDAVVLRLAMIDDFACQLARATLANLPAEPVRLARNIRRRIADTDGRVDFSAVWKIGQTELPSLIAGLEQYLRSGD